MLKVFKINERGNAMVEFALLLPIYLVLLLGAYFLGEACLLRHKVRNAARTIAENRGGWPLATYVRPVMMADTYLFNMNDYEAKSLYLEEEGGGHVDYRDDQRFRSCLSWAIQNGTDYDGVGDDIANILVGNFHYDPVIEEWRGGIIGNTTATIASPTKMIFTPRYSGEEFEEGSFDGNPQWWDEANPAPGQYYVHEGNPNYEPEGTGTDFYYGYFNVRARYTIVRGGGPNFPVPSDTEPFEHWIEPVVTEKFADNASPAGRMPPSSWDTLWPSDSVLWPRNPKFPFSWELQQQQGGSAPGGRSTP
jgi:Flp pilus assembly pilin Flp